MFLTGKKEIQYLEKRLKIELEKSSNQQLIHDDDDENFFENHETTDVSNIPKKV